jgi:hypothetical protein
MLYVALTFWLLVAVIAAWGVHRLWCSMLPARAVNILLLPGTLIALLGHIVGLLVTGATVTSATLYKDDGSGDPETTTNPKPRIPVVGAVVIGMLPLLACGAGVYFTSRYLGDELIRRLPSGTIGPDLPRTVPAVFEFLRAQITLVESLVLALRASDFSDWRTGVYLYLLVCLTIRMAPFEGTVRGALAAIVLLGAGAAGITSLFEVADPRVQTGWSVLNLTIASLLLLLLATLLIRGAVGLVQVLRNNA